MYSCKAASRIVHTLVLTFLWAGGQCAWAAPFAPDSVVVLRVHADNGAVTNSNAAQLFLDEYGSSGWVQSIPIPTTGPNALVVSANAVAEGALSRSPNGRWVCFAGYRAPVDVANVTTSSSALYPREIASVDAFGNYAVAAAPTSYFSGISIRTAASDGTNNFWGAGALTAGSTGGLIYYGYDQSSTTVDAGNRRVVAIVNGSLFCTYAQNTSGGLYKYAGLPRTAATPTRVLLDTNSPYAFALNATETVAYLADDTRDSTGGVRKYTYAAGTWSLAYTLSVGVANAGARGLAVDWSGPNPVLYATTGENSIYGNPGNRLIRLEDTGPGAVATTLAANDANNSFRGVAFAPQAFGSQSQISRLSVTGEDVRIDWLAAAGNTYVLQASTNVAAGSSFTDLSPEITLSGSGVVATNWLDAGAMTNSTQRFYRIRSR